MALISVNNITFYYEGSSDYIFEDVSFQMDTNWKLGFVSRNGRGKTTFLKLLMNSMRKKAAFYENSEYEGKETLLKYEYRGSITSSVEFDYFPFFVRDFTEITLQIVEKLYPEYEFWMLCRELSFLQVDTDVLYRPFDTLSNGERVKVMLAVLFSRENKFLLIDEPTNHLDVEARKVVKDYLSRKKGFILVSHDRDFLDQCIDHILVINKTNIEIFQGNFSTWWENKKNQDAWELSENEKIKKDIKRLAESAAEKSKWAEDVEATKIGGKAFQNQKTRDNRAYIGEKSRRMQMMYKNLEKRRQKAVSNKENLLKNLETTEVLQLNPLRHYKKVLVSVEDVKIFYEQTDGERRYLSKVNFKIDNGDCVVLQGKNGCGKSSIIKAILHDSKVCYEGKIATASGLIISYVSQDTGFLKGKLSDYALEYGLDLTLFLTLLKKLDFERKHFEKRIEDYSEGQKKKVLIARSLCEKAHLYIWDEPLNYIDVFSRMQIEELLIKYRPTLLLVEHDKTFVDKLANVKINCV